MIWPNEVYILDPRYFKVTGGPGCNEQNNPLSFQGWAEAELKSKYCIQNNRGGSLNLMVQIWVYRFQRLSAYQAKYRNTYTMFDVYNATWASLGFVDGQSKKVITLSSKLTL